MQHLKIKEIETELSLQFIGKNKNKNKKDNILNVQPFLEHEKVVNERDSLIEQLKQITISTDIQNKKAIHSLSETSEDDFQKPKKKKLCTIKTKVNVINLTKKNM